MATGFDPYHRWLSIPPPEQPPNHYRLLGLNEFEDSVEVIENAAERQITHVRPHLQSPLRPYATNLIRELDVARKCLLDPEAKVAYDSWLDQRYSRPVSVRAPKAKHQVVSAPPLFIDQIANVPRRAAPIPPQTGQDGFSQEVSEPGDQFSLAATPTFTPSLVTHRARYRRKSRNNPIAGLVLWVMGGAIGLLAGYAVLCMLDPKYDFLNLMFRKVEQEASAPSESRVASIAPLPTPRSNTAEREKPRRIQPKSAPSRNRADDKSTVIVEPLLSDSESDDQFLNRFGTSRFQRLRFDIPEVLPLPSLQSIGNPAMLAPFAIAGDKSYDLDELDLTLIQGTGHSEGRLSLTTTDASSKTWTAYWVPLLSGDADEQSRNRTEVGTFSLIEQVLCFAWSASVSESTESAIRNSLLRFQLGGTSHRVALRVPDELGYIEIDLRKLRDPFLLSCSYMPNIEEIFLDITDTSLLPAHASLVPKYSTSGADVAKLKLSDVAYLSYREAPSASTRISIGKRGSRLAIDVGSRFVLPSGLEDEWTIARGNRKAEYLRKELANARARSDTRRTAMLQTDINALQQVADLSRRWKDGAKLPLRFYIEVDGHEVELAKSKSE